MRWEKIHFKLNKAFWRHYGYEAALPFRVMNLIDLQTSLKNLGIDNWIFGRSLLDLIVNKKLLDDHDDDLAVNCDKEFFLSKEFQECINSLNFSVIRKTTDMISIERYGRYIDLHAKKSDIYDIEKILAHGNSFYVRTDSKKLLVDKYGHDYSNRRKIESSNWWMMKKIMRFILNYETGLIGLLRLFKARYKRIIKLGFDYFFNRLKVMLTFKKTRFKLTEEQFLDLKIDDDDAVNWTLRGLHTEALIKRGETFREARDRLMKSNIFEEYPNSTEEIDTSRAFNEPMNLSLRFWSKGNNLFLYPAIFGFRHLVMPYHAANLYINAEIKPNIYSASYFDNLPKMTDCEIENFLASNPLEIKNNALSSGRHRACAMLGRLVKGQSYIPIYVRHES